MEDKFKMYKKWFWIGVVVGSLNVVAGVVYAIAMIMEPEHKKEGLVILIWSLAFFLLALSVLQRLQ